MKNEKEEMSDGLGPEGISFFAFPTSVGGSPEGLFLTDIYIFIKNKRFF